MKSHNNILGKYHKRNFQVNKQENRILTTTQGEVFLGDFVSVVVPTSFCQRILANFLHPDNPLHQMMKKLMMSYHRQLQIYKKELKLIEKCMLINISDHFSLKVRIYLSA